MSGSANYGADILVTMTAEFDRQAHAIAEKSDNFIEKICIQVEAAYITVIYTF